MNLIISLWTIFYLGNYIFKQLSIQTIIYLDNYLFIQLYI